MDAVDTMLKAMIRGAIESRLEDKDKQGGRHVKLTKEMDAGTLEYEEQQMESGDKQDVVKHELVNDIAQQLRFLIEMILTKAKEGKISQEEAIDTIQGVFQDALRSIQEIL